MCIRLFTPEEIAERTGVEIGEIYRAAYAEELHHLHGDAWHVCPYGHTANFKCSFLNLAEWLGKDRATELFKEKGEKKT